MGRRAALWIASSSLVALVLLHLDFWRPQRARLVLGWVPEELAYRLVFIVLAWLYLLFVTARLWREDPD